MGLISRVSSRTYRHSTNTKMNLAGLYKEPSFNGLIEKYTELVGFESELQDTIKSVAVKQANCEIVQKRVADMGSELKGDNEIKDWLSKQMESYGKVEDLVDKEWVAFTTSRLATTTKLMLIPRRTPAHTLTFQLLQTRQ